MNGIFSVLHDAVVSLINAERQNLVERIHKLSAGPQKAAVEKARRQRFREMEDLHSPVVLALEQVGWQPDAASKRMLDLNARTTALIHWDSPLCGMYVGNNWVKYPERNAKVRCLKLIAEVETALEAVEKWGGVTIDQKPPTREKPAEPAVPVTWQEAAERMKRLRAQGEPWKSCHKLAGQLGCSSGTIHKAIRETAELQTWAKRKNAAAPRARSINDVVTDRTAQNREPDPVDDVAIREFLEQEDLKPEVRAFFNSLSRDTQLDFLDDPDKYCKILGRKP